MPEPKPNGIEVRKAASGGFSFDPKTRTFSAVAATASPVIRRGFDGRYHEVLEISPGAIRLARLKSGRAPLLDSHRAGSVASQIGVVTGARIENGQLVIDGKLSARDDELIQRISADLAAGVIRNVSVGYSVHASEESRGRDGELVVTQTDWEPYEVSLVSIPADANAHVRNLRGTEMPQTEIEHEQPADEAPQAPVRRAMSDRHACEAYEIAARAGLPAEFARQHIDNGVTLADFRTAALTERARVADQTSISSRSHHEDAAGETLDNPEFLRRTISAALYARMSGNAPEGAAAEIMGRSMLDMGEMLLKANGERVSWRSRDALADRILTRGGQHTTSDFPILLTEAGTRVLGDAYQATRSPLIVLAKKKNAADFRPVSLLKLSEAPALEKIGESGEVKHGTRGETKEGYRVETFARIFSLSRNAIINDDLDAFADISQAWGKAASDLEANELLAALTANSGNGVNLDDGNPIYSTARGNKSATGTVIDVANLAVARQALREMKGLDGKTPIGVAPKHLLVGPAKETQAEQVLAALAAAQVSNVNPFSNKLTLHVEPRLTGNSWRLFADPAAVPVLARAYLDGNESPQIDTREGWSTLGAEFRCVFDFGCGAIDYRGSYLNAGA